MAGGLAARLRQAARWLGREILSQQLSLLIGLSDQ